MIHDAQVEITCDGPDCAESVFVELDYVYTSYGGNGGHYNSDDSAIERNLKIEHAWIVDDGKHFCSQDCRGAYWNERGGCEECGE